jgi:hypothetical protein
LRSSLVELLNWEQIGNILASDTAWVAQ